MAYDEHLADRIRRVLKEKKRSAEEIKMFGGLCFMVDQKMCFGIVNSSLMAKVGERMREQLLPEKNVQEMDFTGRPMKAFIFVTPEGIDQDKDLERYIQYCLDFNPFAKVSKKRKKN